MLDKIKERAQAATEGRWRGSSDFGHHLDVKATMLVADFGNSFLALGRVIHMENLDFIVHAKADISWLVERLKEARAGHKRLSQRLAESIIQRKRLKRERDEVRAELKAARHVLEMDDPRLLKAVQTIERVLKERDESRGKLEAVEALDCFDHIHSTTVFLPHCPRCQFDRILRGEDCICGGPSTHPCGPACKYPYTDAPKEK